MSRPTVKQIEEAMDLVRRLAEMHKDGEIVNGEEFVLESDDAVDDLHAAISSARDILGKKEGT